VPVLEDGELVLFESLAINLYLAETYGRDSLWPKGASDRARTVQWSFWAMTESNATCFAVLFQSAASSSRPAQVERQSRVPRDHPGSACRRPRKAALRCSHRCARSMRTSAGAAACSAAPSPPRT